MNFEAFTPLEAIIGGALIGIAASTLLILNGRVAGLSGVIGGVLDMRAGGELAWRVALVLGLVLGGAAVAAWRPEMIGESPRSLPLVAIAGALVGAGTRIGGGCTSGHGVCGLSRLSKRSLVATTTFMSAGILAASAARVLGADT